jgi:2-oxoglutarate dehydrogenase E1 component
MAADVGPVCLLPHGFEGQGPEHSSARLERFLQMSAKTTGSWPTAPHRPTISTSCAASCTALPQAADPDDAKIAAASQAGSQQSAEDFTTGSSFHRVLWDDAQYGNSDTKLVADDKIKRVVMCSGKVYYDLLEERDARGIDDVYLLRIEQFYPFPAQSLVRNWRFSHAEMVWCQEEPKNQGAWSFIEPNIEWVLGRIKAKHGRPPMPAAPPAPRPATGLGQPTKHNKPR